MGFGNPRGQLAKLILPRTTRKGGSHEEEDDDSPRKNTNDDDATVEESPPAGVQQLPLVLTHRLNVVGCSVSVQENEGVEQEHGRGNLVYGLPTDAMGMPNFHMASPSPKGGHCQKKFFDGDHHLDVNRNGNQSNSSSKEQPWMLENRLKGLFNNFRNGGGPNKQYQGSTSSSNNGDVEQQGNNTTIRTSPKRKNTSKRSLVSSLSSPRDPIRHHEQEEVDERTHLILDAAMADEWSERQLAFDLESVVEDTSSSLMWMIHSDEDEDVTMSIPPQPESLSCNTGGRSTSHPLSLQLTIDTDFASDLDSCHNNQQQQQQQHQPALVGGGSGNGAAQRRRSVSTSSRRSTSSRSKRLLQYSPQLATVFEEDEGMMGGESGELYSLSIRTCDTEFFSFDDNMIMESMDCIVTGTDNEEL
jgi:hypothetical protein